MLCLSYALAATWNRRRLPSSSIGMYPSSSTTRSLALPIRGGLPVEPVLRVGAQQSHDELGGGEEPGRHALQAGLPGQRDGQVGLAGAGRAEHGHVLRVLDEVEGFQCLPPVVDGEAQGRPGRSRRASWFGGTRPV